MTLIIENSSITTSSGSLILEEEGKRTELRNGKVIITDKFVSLDTYVFPRGTPIPIAYLAVAKTGSSAVFRYNRKSGQLLVENGKGELIKAPYTDLGIFKIISDDQIVKQFSLSVCQSNISSDAAVEIRELTFYRENKSFDKSIYNVNLRAPSIICNSQVIPYTSDGNFTVHLNGDDIVITSSLNGYSYICLFATL